MSLLGVYKPGVDSLPGPMPTPQWLAQAWSLLSLRGTRTLLSPPRYRVLVGLIGLSYAFIAMLVGGMFYLPSSPLREGWFFYLYPSGPGPSWAYPTILAGSPYFQLNLPFLSAILMTLTSAGIGLGMSLGVLLGIRLIRRRREGSLGPTAVGTAAGLTPAMIGLVTLGACCSTTAAATAGISLVAQSSGTSPAVALANAWYLGVFQVIVVYIALLAQEQLVTVYGFLVSRSTSGSPSHGDPAPVRPPLGWKGIGSAALRIALVAGGIAWSLSMLADWFVTPPAKASTTVWFGWVFQHQVPGILAVLVVLFPQGTLAFWTKLSRGSSALAIRVTLVISGLALVTWIPTPLTGTGAAALGNELLGFWQLPVGWGAVSPPALGIVGLSLRWALQFGFLGALAVAMGISPTVALKPLLRSSGASPATPTLAVTREPAHTLTESG